MNTNAAQYAESVVPDTHWLQQKVMHQRIALNALEKARGEVVVKSISWSHAEGYHVLAIEWGDHQWVRLEAFEREREAHQKLGQHLAQAYMEMATLKKRLAHIDGTERP